MNFGGKDEFDLQVVDGCITNDGDAFLYGAVTVYRNFTTNSKARDIF